MSVVTREALLAELQTHLQYTFRTLPLLDQALTHRSYAHEVDASHGDYERLEFLGDAVLGLIVSTSLYATHPQAREGQLSQRRSRLVKQRTLALLARQLGLGQVLLLGRGEDQQGGRQKDSLLAAALEAVVAALYLDGGFRQTQEIVLRCLGELLTAELQQESDYKGLLQTQALHSFGCLPTYHLLQAEGPPHQQTFHVQLTLNQEYQCVGIGRRKKAAEQHAAQQLLAQLHQTPDVIQRAPC